LLKHSADDGFVSTEICTKVGKRIGGLRRAKGWRQIDLAQHSGVHEVHISDPERGAREPGLITLYKIASALDVSMSELLKGV
jgi:transcriptional regulator with XRE-family HTH domain